MEILSSLKNIDAYSLNLGILLGCSLLAIIMIFKVILFLIFRRKKKSVGIDVQAENGNIFISSNAISDLIKALEPNYSELTFLKIVLLQKKKNQCALNIQISFQMHEKGLSEIIIMLQSDILKELKRVFNIETITQINIKVKKTEVAK